MLDNIIKIELSNDTSFIEKYNVYKSLLESLSVEQSEKFEACKYIGIRGISVSVEKATQFRHSLIHERYSEDGNNLIERSEINLKDYFSCLNMIYTQIKIDNIFEFFLKNKDERLLLHIDPWSKVTVAFSFFFEGRRESIEPLNESS